MTFPLDNYFGHLFFLPVQALLCLRLVSKEHSLRGAEAWRAVWRALLEARWPSCRGLALTEEPRAFFERRRRAERPPELERDPKSDDFEVLVEIPGEFQGCFRLLERDPDLEEYHGSHAIYVPFQCSQEKLRTMRLSLTLVRKSDGKTLRICRGSQITQREGLAHLPGVVMRNDEDFGAHLGAWQSISLISTYTGIVIEIEYHAMMYDDEDRYEPNFEELDYDITARHVLRTWETFGVWRDPSDYVLRLRPWSSDYVALVELRAGRRPPGPAYGLGPVDPQVELEYLAAKRRAFADAQTVISGAFGLDCDRNTRGLHVVLPGATAPVSTEGTDLYLSVTLYRKSDGKCFGFCKDARVLADYVDDCYIREDGHLGGRLGFSHGENLMPEGSIFSDPVQAAELRVTRFGDATGKAAERMTQQERQELDDWVAACNNHRYGWPLVVDEDTKRRFQEDLESDRDIRTPSDKLRDMRNLRAGTLLQFDLCLGHHKLTMIQEFNDAPYSGDRVDPRVVLRAWRDMGLWV